MVDEDQQAGLISSNDLQFPPQTHKGALMLGDDDRARVNGIVDAWNRALELNPPAAMPMQIQRS